MKKFTVFSLVFLLLFALLVGCSKDNNDDNNPTGPGTTTGGSMTAKVNGADWNANTAVVATYSNNVLTVTGQANPGGTQSEQIQIVIQGITATGTFTLTMIGNTGRMTKATSTTNIVTYVTMDNNAGSVTITELTSSSVKGTFHFTAKNVNNPSDVLTIENGSFSATF